MKLWAVFSALGFDIPLLQRTRIILAPDNGGRSPTQSRLAPYIQGKLAIKVKRVAAAKVADLFRNISGEAVFWDVFGALCAISSVNGRLSI
jgi:hypothetical protein